MRTINSVIFVLLLIISSCSKSTNNPAPDPGTGGPITITSISPAMPYADDEITITGTGFNPDKTKDTVDFGIGDPATGLFYPYGQGQGTASKAVVISASATQLVIKSATPDSALTLTSGLDYQLFKTLNFGNNASNHIRIRANSLKAISNLTPFKQLPDMVMSEVVYYGQWYNYGPYSWLQPNDSVSVFLYGVNSSIACESKVFLSCSKSSCSFVDGYLTLNGLSPQCNCDNFGTIVYGCGGTVFQGKLINYIPDQHFAEIHFLVPSNFFGTGINPGNSGGIRIKIKVENTDGKSKTKLVVCMVYPNH